MIRLILGLLDIVLTVAVIWIAHRTGKWAEQFADPGYELIYYLGALVAVLVAGTFAWISFRQAVFKR